MTQDTKAPERIWIDPWGGNWSPVDGGTQEIEYARADLLTAVEAERDRLAALLKTMTARAEVASRYQDDHFNFGWVIKEVHATLAKMENTND